MYSFVGAYGESVPPQFHKDAPFVDEVWQSVSVGPLNDPANGKPYFIHQAGIYQRDGDHLDERNWFSPSLGRYCSGNACYFVAWGQHAHVPTNFTSSCLYLNRYVDCGNGTLEMTAMIHNGAPEDDTTSVWDYLNVPWGGVRTSVLRDALVGRKDEPGMDMVVPIPDWGSSVIQNLRDVGGYLTFAQDLPLPQSLVFRMPCGVPGSSGSVDCGSAGAEPLVLKLAKNNACAESAGHTSTWGLYTVRCKIESTVNLHIDGCRSCGLRMTNSRTGNTVDGDVLHWSFGSTDWYWWPKATAEDINADWLMGDEIIVTYADNGMPEEDNLALTVVFGHDSSTRARRDFRTGQRYRLGTGGSTTRDYTVFTVNDFPNLSQGKTYYNRQYFVSGRFVEADATARSFASKTTQGMFPADHVNPGRTVSLYSEDGGDSFITTLTEYNETEPLSCGTKRCSGWTTPRSNALPLYAVRCGDSSYVGPDQYVFSWNGGAVRPYMCSFEGRAPVNATLRPALTLLGFFEQGACEFLQNATYDEYGTCQVVVAQSRTVSSSGLSFALIAVGVVVLAVLVGILVAKRRNNPKRTSTIDLASKKASHDSMKSHENPLFGEKDGDEYLDVTNSWYETTK